MRCDECRFLESLPLFNRRGLCHRFPRVSASVWQIKRGSEPWTFPVMFNTDWCGEFRAKEGVALPPKKNDQLDDEAWLQLHDLAKERGGLGVLRMLNLLRRNLELQVFLVIYMICLLIVITLMRYI